MAIYHLAVKSVSRATGRSAVAAAAYRSGAKLTNDRDGLTHDYRRRAGVEASFILAPAGAEWAEDRSALWNAAEAAEKRKDAKVAREYELALPAQLDGPARAALVRAFGEELRDRYGVAVDAAIHAPHDYGDDRNHHAHILTTTRIAGPEGLGDKTRQLDVRSTASEEVEQLRAAWSGMVNQALERAGRPERVDHRSYARQGLGIEPTIKLGHASAAIERKAQRQRGLGQEPRAVTPRGQLNEAIKETRRIGVFLERGREWLRDAYERVRGLAGFMQGAAKVAREELGGRGSASGGVVRERDQERHESPAARRIAERLEQAGKTRDQVERERRDRQRDGPDRGGFER